MNKLFTIVALASSVILLGVAGCSNEPNDPNNDPTRPAGTLYLNGGTGARTYSLSLSGGSTTNLFSGVDAFPTPEGTYIVCTADGLQEVSGDGTSARMIVQEDIGQPFDQTFDDAFKSPQLSPDGQYIAYEGQLGYVFDVYVVDRYSGELITSFTDPGTGMGFLRPSWLPDGSLIMAGATNTQGIYLTDENLSNPTRIDDNLTRPDQPIVSPNGQQVALIVNKHVYTMNIDGSALKQITTSDSEESWPTWSPDGKSLAFYGSNSILLLELSSNTVYDVRSINSVIDNFVSFTADRRGQFQWVN